MGVLTLTAQEEVAAPPAVVFGLFGASSGAGWIFDAQCDRVVPGASVSLWVPLGESTAGPVEILGRIGRLQPSKLIEIVHDQPWRGRTVLRLARAGQGTRVRLHTELDRHGLEWLMRRRGLALRNEENGNPRLVPRVVTLFTVEGAGQ